MRDDMDRRKFLKTSVAASAGTAFGMGAAADAQSGQDGPVSAGTGKKGMPMGRIGDLKVSRLISGGNLLGGWAHARDLNYVGQLMRHYNTEEKILDTFELMEQNGINTIIAYIAGKRSLMSLMERYWNERGGDMQWIAQGVAEVDDLEGDIKWSVDHGASAMYMNGAMSERWLEEGRLDLLGKYVDCIKEQGIPAGYGAHDLDAVLAAESAGFDVDFYMKTLHRSDYWSFTPTREHNNVWCTTPQKTIDFMRDVDKPWIGFKVLAAGAIHPNKGFEYAFQNGADFICVGMFDWQVEQDARIARRVFSKVARSGRKRAWYA